MEKPGQPPIRRCPRCSGRLAQVQYRGVDIHLCARCEGALIAQAALRPLLSRLSRELRSHETPVPEVGPLPDKGEGIACPLCGGKMEHHGYMGSKRVFVDSCADCAVLWADPGELGAMAIQFGNTQDLQLRRQRSSLGPSRACFKPSEVEKMIGEAFLAGVTAGVGGGGILRSWLVVKEMLNRRKEGHPYGSR